MMLHPLDGTEMPSIPVVSENQSLLKQVEKLQKSNDALRIEVDRLRDKVATLVEENDRLKQPKWYQRIWTKTLPGVR